jgi:hypothetical protein
MPMMQQKATFQKLAIFGLTVEEEQIKSSDIAHACIICFILLFSVVHWLRVQYLLF